MNSTQKRTLQKNSKYLEVPGISPVRDRGSILIPGGASFGVWKPYEAERGARLFRKEGNGQTGIMEFSWYIMETLYRLILDMARRGAKREVNCITVMLLGKFWLCNEKVWVKIGWLFSRRNSIWKGQRTAKIEYYSGRWSLWLQKTLGSFVFVQREGNKESVVGWYRAPTIWRGLKADIIVEPLPFVQYMDCSWPLELIDQILDCSNDGGNFVGSHLNTSRKMCMLGMLTTLFHQPAQDRAKIEWRGV